MGSKTNTCRKWVLEINDPDKHGLSQSVLIDKLNTLQGEGLYFCMCDEIGGESNRYHTHVFIYRDSSIRFGTIQKLFGVAHIEKGRGTTQQNREYILKAGENHNKNSEGYYDFVDSKGVRHYGRNLSDTFYESGQCPIEEQGVDSAERLIVDMVQNGATDIEIIATVPKAYKDVDKIQRLRSAYRDKAFADCWRDITCIYIFGKTGSGKTRSVMDEYGYKNVYRVTDYVHPFDSYDGQDVIIFEEFRSGIKQGDMLNYLDGYPLLLPCRYFNRQACYTKVYIISNIAPDEQYIKIDRESRNAFYRRINQVIEYDHDGKHVYDGVQAYQQRMVIES